MTKAATATFKIRNTTELSVYQRIVDMYADLAEGTDRLMPLRMPPGMQRNGPTVIAYLHDIGHGYDTGLK